MNRTMHVLATSAALCACGVAGMASRAPAQEMPGAYQEVLTILGKKGDYKANVLKVNIPRSDLSVTVDGVAVPTSFGFGGWLAMTRGEHGMDVMMGDLVLLQDEVNPVMSALLDNGLQVTALHNHFFFDQPRIFFMHVHGMGTPAELAQKAKPAVDLIGHVPARSAAMNRNRLRLASNAAGQAQVTAGDLDTARLDQLVGKTGEKLAGGVYKYTVGRDDLHLRDMGANINARMGLNTWAAFFGSQDNAVVAGDVAMLADEIQPVLKALRSHGIEVVAIHNHMTDTRPPIFFLHYWGRGHAATLADGFRAALDATSRR